MYYGTGLVKTTEVPFHLGKRQELCRTNLHFLMWEKVFGGPVPEHN
jgi:hypothetical protein